MYPIAGRSPGVVQKSIATVKSFYYDSFKWNIVKCMVIAGLGVGFARQCRGFELMPPTP